MIVEGLSARQEREYKKLAWLAWHTASLQRTKKMPRLERLMRTNKKNAPQTWEEQLVIMSEWSKKIDDRINRAREMRKDG